MKRRFLITTLVLLTLLQTSIPIAMASRHHSKKALSPSKIRVKPCAAQIKSILKDPIFTQTFVGIKVVSLKTGKIIYQYNADKLFRPASNVKLFTTATALALLGKDFQFKTEVYADSNFQNGILSGAIYIKGYGDPLLRTEHIDSLVRRIHDYGIRSIKGDIIGDVSYFDDLFWGKGWMWDDDPEYHAPYLSALSINSNTVNLTVTSGTKDGDSVQVLMIPPTSYCTIINHARTSSARVEASSDTNLSQLTITRRWKERENILVIEGWLPPLDTVTYTLNVWKPEFYALTLFKEKLLTHGITVDGTIRLDTVHHAFRVASVSHSLDSVAVVVNKESFNLGAENILKALAAEKHSKPGSGEVGISIVKTYLNTIGIDTTELIIVDGSGKSRYNLVSPNTITQLLIYQYKNPAAREQFLRTFPIAGVDGTLKNRMTVGPARGSVLAKTGTHSDALALSGYANIKKGDVLVFSVLLNHFAGDVTPYRKAQDRIVEILINCK